MNQDQYYKTLLSMIKALRSERASIDVDADIPTSAPTLVDEKLQNQKKDVQDKNAQPSNTSAKLDEEISQLNLAVAESGESQDVGEVSLDQQQKYVDLVPEYDCTNLIHFMPAEIGENNSLFISILKCIYKGQYETAKTNCEVILEKLLNGTRTNNNDLDISSYFELLIFIFRKTKKCDDAIVFLSKVLDIRKSILGSSHRIVGITLNNLGICHGMFGNYMEAHSLCTNALQIALKSGDALFIARQFYYLGALHQMQEQYYIATGFYLQGLDHYGRVFKPDHPNIKKVVQNLTTCYLEQGKVKEAEALQERYYNEETITEN